MIRTTLKKIINWALDADANADVESREEMWAVKSAKKKSNRIVAGGGSHADPVIVDNMQRMNITIHRATGGYAIEYRQYDPREDETYSKIHIATDTDDLGEVLSKIIVIENLRR